MYQNCGQFESLGNFDATTNFSNSSGTGNKAILDCSKPVRIEDTVLSRMTRKQIYLSLLDLVGHNNEEDLKLLPTDSSNDKGLRNDSSQQLLFPDDGKKLFTFFEKVIDDAVARREPKIFTCDISSTTCVESIIDNIAYLSLIHI